MDTLPGGGNSFKMVLSPFWKGVYSKRKEIASQGSKFLAFRVDPFSRGAWCAEKTKKESLKLSPL